MRLRRRRKLPSWRLQRELQRVEAEAEAAELQRVPQQAEAEKAETAELERLKAEEEVAGGALVRLSGACHRA